MSNNNNKNKDSFNKMVLLTAVKIFGILFSFAIPMYLGRKLSIETYGTYKQLMLFFWFAQVALSFSLFVTVLFLISCAINLIKQDEVQHLRELLKIFFRKKSSIMG